MTKKLAPVHLGEVLREDFLEPMDLSAGALARVVVYRARGSSG